MYGHTLSHSSTEQEAALAAAPEKGPEEDASKSQEEEAQKMQAAAEKKEELRVAKAAEAQRITEDTARAKAAAQAAEAKEKEEEIQALAAEGDAICSFPPETIKNLSTGLDGLNSEALQYVAAVLHSLQAQQVAIIEQLAHQDRKVMTLPHMADVAQALSHVPSYTKKLQDIRKDMDAVSNR